MVHGDPVPAEPDDYDGHRFFRGVMIALVGVVAFWVACAGIGLCVLLLLGTSR